MPQGFPASWRPKPGSAVLLEEEHDRVYFYHQKKHSYALLDNDIAIQIARLCDGSRSVEKIVAALLRHFPKADPEQVRRDVTAMLGTLAKAGFLASDDGRDV